MKFLSALLVVSLIPSSFSRVTNDNDVLWEHDLFGGHSREFQSIYEPIDWNDIATRGRQPRSARSTKSSEKEINISDNEITEFITSHQSAGSVLIDNMKKIMENEWVSISMRIKSFQSLKNKLSLKNYTLSQIKDVIGMRLTVQTISEAKHILRLLSTTHNKTFVIEFVKCYGICENAKINYTEAGYRRVHLLIKIQPYDKWAEIQIGTPYTNMWSDWSHDFLYKGELSKTINEPAHDYVKRVGEYLFQLDLQRDKMVSCPSILKETQARSIFDPKVYDQLGRPKNLCFSWNDIYLKVSVPEYTNLASAPRAPVLLISLAGLLILIFS